MEAALLKSRACRLPCAVAGALAIVVMSACTTGAPAQPSASGSAASSSSLSPSIAAPTPLSPVNGAQVGFGSQPITVVVLNAVSTRGSVTYTVEVAFDANFSSKVQTKDSVVEGTGGQTSVRLDPLLPSNAYYWHARAQGGGTTGVFGAAFKFTIGAQVTLSTPVALAPLSGSIELPLPVLTVTNVVRTGQPGPLTYRFDIADSAAFANIVVTGTVNEGSSRTSFAPSQPLAIGRVFFWRATAIDQLNFASSTPSAAQSFTTIPSIQALLAAEEGLQLWPGVQPPGTTGHARMGDNWDVDTHVAHDGTHFLSPLIDELQIFDLLDRGMDPPSAIAWMHANGYGTTASWYPNPIVIGFGSQYMAAIDPNTGLPNINGAWTIIEGSG